MNAFDLDVTSLFNQVGQASEAANRLLFVITQSNFLTWVPITALLWWVWFQEDGRKSCDREAVSSILLACMLIAVTFYLLQESPLALAHRPRPMFNPHSHFQMPDGVGLPGRGSYWASTSSFPSGHAAILATIGVGLLDVSGPLGAFGLSYALLASALRVLFGFHYGTDIIGGALLGVTLLCVVRSRFLADFLVRPILRWSSHHPGAFYAVLFLITLDIATGFSETRELLHLVRHVGVGP